MKYKGDPDPAEEKPRHDKHYIYLSKEVDEFIRELAGFRSWEYKETVNRVLRFYFLGEEV